MSYVAITAGVDDWFAQEVEQGVTNAVVFDASRSEQKFHDASPYLFRESRKAPRGD
jgi:hypothetical protein